MARYLCALCLFTGAAYAASTDKYTVGNIFKPVTTPGHEILNIATLAILACTGIFLVVSALLAYTVVRFRSRKEHDLEEPPQVFGSNYIEAAWTVIPLLIVFVLIMVTARVVAGIQDTKPSDQAIRASVIGHQWWWQIDYPAYGFTTANELNIPETADGHLPTFLRLSSADVIHDFWVPQLGGKWDVVPNRFNDMWFDPKQTGTYLGNCAEYCGTQHANMLIRVVVHPKDEFEQWVNEQRRPAVNDPAVSEQRAVFESLSCVNCHNVRGTSAAGKFGPDLTHLMSRRTLASGMVENNRDQLRAWIKDPQTVKPGCQMPSMLLSDAQLDAVVAYLVTLK
jgi:cytochrome c oxidase subunit II